MSKGTAKAGPGDDVVVQPFMTFRFSGRNHGLSLGRHLTRLLVQRSHTAQHISDQSLPSCIA